MKIYHDNKYSYNKIVLNLLPLLLNSFYYNNACLILGSGVSYPHIPSMYSFKKEIEKHADLISSFPPELKRGYLHSFLSPILPHEATSFSELKQSHLTGASLATLLEYYLNPELDVIPSNYLIFRYFPKDIKIINFNWDKHVETFCPQETIIHPHERSYGRSLLYEELNNILFYTQSFDDEDGQSFLSSPLVLPGEENTKVSRSLFETVFNIWKNTDLIIVIGYSFGILSGFKYDKIWYEYFIEAMHYNKIPIHVLCPDAFKISGEISEKLKRLHNIYPWAFRWDIFSKAYLKLLVRLKHHFLHPARNITKLLLYEYSRLING